MRNLLRWLLVAAVVLAADAAVADRDIDGVPLPDAPPGGHVEPPPGSFRGAWVGRWGSGLKHILIVESVAPDGTANVIYAYGDAPDTPRKWIRPGAWVSGNTLTVNGPGFMASYYMASATWIEAFYESGPVREEAELKRTSFATLPGMRFADGEGKSIMIDSGLHEDGQPVRLEVVIFKPEGAGRFPLLVVNHGSTGTGKKSEMFKRTFARRAFAEIFVSKGYLVAYPQRRGRGKSDGLYDEGFNANRDLGYSCEPSRSLAGVERALDDIKAAVKVLRQRADVAAGPVLTAGHSRGGALSVAFAGMHPADVAGVINFVGGWLGNKGDCQNTASEVNTNLLRRGGPFPRSTLWLYGDDDDTFYSLQHSRKNFEAFETAHGRGTFHSFDAPGPNSHYVMFFPSLWKTAVDGYLVEIGAMPDK